MEKWIETKDTEAVAEALRGGLQASTITDRDCNLYLRMIGEVLCVSGGTALQTIPGRIFRIEVPRHEAPEGWDVLDHDAPLPGAFKEFSNGAWRDGISIMGCEQRRDCWYAIKKEDHKSEPKPAPNPKMVRVEFTKGKHGMFAAKSLRHGTWSYVSAPAILGPGGYEYEGSTRLFSDPVRYLVDGELYPIADMEDIESGRAVPVLPVAYWHMKESK